MITDERSERRSRTGTKKQNTLKFQTPRHITRRSSERSYTCPANVVTVDFPFVPDTAAS
ncbi:hypothetical protein Mapa_006315 [Marchantia paleacea]|nr:hypothetical protein Mapa_006315 [Marchantia paleacea]